MLTSLDDHTTAINLDDDNILSWEKIILIGAEYLGGPAASGILSMIFDHMPNKETMLTDAIDEICARIKKIIEDAFVREYIASTDSITRRLRGYHDTVSNLKDFNTIESILALNFICTLHLIIIQALSENADEEKREGYKNNLSHIGKEYSNICRSKSGRIVQITKESIQIFQLPSTLNPNDYYIQEYTRLGNTYAELKFHAQFLDSWTKSWHEIWSDSYELTNPMMYFKEHRYSSKYKLSPWALNDPDIFKKRDEFIIKATQEFETYFNNKLIFPKQIEDEIFKACDKWEKL